VRDILQQLLRWLTSKDCGGETAGRLGGHSGLAAYFWFLLFREVLVVTGAGHVEAIHEIPLDSGDDLLLGRCHVPKPLLVKML